MNTALKTSKRHILFALLLVIASSCSSSIYEIVNEGQYQTKVSQSRQRKYILLRSSYFNPVVDLETLIKDLNRNQYLSTANTYSLQNQERKFVESIYFLKTGNYAQALHMLETIDNTAFDCQVMILNADCKMELQLQVDALETSQSSLDCTEHPIVREIAKNRYRFYTYGL